jgi:UDP-N-acetylmuramoyl-tripeptide--D-alanyl-D-alanine ligase
MKKILLSFLKSVLLLLSRLTIKRFDPTIVAVTGSAGKTSSKEAIWAALKNRYYVRKTLANFNNELGVPLSILGNYSSIQSPVWFFWIKVLIVGFLNLIFKSKNTYPQILVLEYGADKPKDISHLLKIAKPHVAVISAIGQIPVHVENYPQGIEGVTKEKGKIIFDLLVDDYAVLNADDSTVMKLKEKTRAKVITFGFSNEADIKISNFKHIINNGKIEGITFKLENQSASVPVVLKNVFSISHAYAAACAASVAMVFDLNLVDSANAFALNYTPVKGRSIIIDGIKQTQIIDESYNSSPLALEIALKSIALIKDSRKIAVLGDMTELGDFTLKAHEMIGDIVPSCVDILITVGLRAKFIAYRAIKKGMDKDSVFLFDDVDKAGLFLQQIIKKGDLILIKGSRVVGLDKIVEEIKAM